MRAGQRRRGRRPIVGQTARGRGQGAGAESVISSEGVSGIHSGVQELNCHVTPVTSRASGVALVCL